MEKSAHVTLVWVRVEGLWIGGHSSHGEGMFNSNNFATSPCLAKVCALLSAILFFCFTFVLRESRTAYETCWRLCALQILVLLYFTFFSSVSNCRKFTQWRRSVVKYGGHGQSGRAIKLLLQITPYVKWFPNTQQSRLPTARRRLEKLVLPSTFELSLSSLMTWNLQLSNNSFEWKNVTF